MSHVPSKLPSAAEIAALRHLVYDELLSMLPVASYEQACRFVANLGLARNGDHAATGSAERERRINAALMRFLTLRVTPELCETRHLFEPPFSIPEIEYFLNRKFGMRLRHVPGFYRRDVANSKGPRRGNAYAPTLRSRHGGLFSPLPVAPFAVNLVPGCALYGYGTGIRDKGQGHTHSASNASPRHSPLYAGLLLQPLNEIDRFWLLSSAKHGGPRATPLSAADRQYFESEVNV
jgi:hypothetical protein